MLELFLAGGPVMYPLLLCSMLALGVVVERALFWQRQGAAAVGRALRAAEGAPRAEISRRLRLAAERELMEARRFQSVLSTMVSLAPLLGIFGTVLGIMDSFEFLDPSAPSSAESTRQGLAQALLTTAFGLAIAMASLVGHKLFEGRGERLRHELEERCSQLEIDLGLAPLEGEGE